MIWVDGEFKKDGKLEISTTAQGLSLGMGVFETLLARKGRVQFFNEHLRRLSEAAIKMGFAEPDRVLLKAAVEEIVSGWGEELARVRISIYGLTEEDSSTVVEVSAVPARGSEVVLVESSFRVNEWGALVGVKSTSYGMNVLALREARAMGGDEALMLNSAGCVCEGATSNIFWMIGDRLHTPALETGCLPGVTRRKVIEACGVMGIEVQEVSVGKEALEEAEGIFITNALRGVHRVSCYAGRTLQDPKVDSVIARIQNAYQELAQNHE
ncbi:aminotransferase class IV [Rubritalea tangerina]|uniref:branched-chain-amino-acid transaminase n=2 Tax=Rubritalea tangerina TaxID=430798 RepID=A0ABW4ZDT6_9BACT